ncbi:MAG: sensor histidine kinase [Bacteroidota bacterium]
MEEQADTQISLIIAVGSIAMLLLTSGIIFFVALYQRKVLQSQLERQNLESELQRKILQATLESQENERNSVAGDLHDSIGGMLSAIRVGISAVARHLPEPHKLDASKQMLDDTIDAVRKISRDLMPSTLSKFGLLAAIREHCERMQAITHIQISVVEMGSNKPLSKQRELMVFRIVQELLNNAIKHAQASFIEVVFRYDDHLVLSVEDNGIGMNLDHLEKSGQKSLGLFNVQSRVQLLNATVSIDPQKKEGSKIVLDIPYGE